MDILESQESPMSSGNRESRRNLLGCQRLAKEPSLHCLGKECVHNILECKNDKASRMCANSCSSAMNLQMAVSANKCSPIIFQFRPLEHLKRTLFTTKMTFSFGTKKRAVTSIWSGPCQPLLYTMLCSSCKWTYKFRG